MRETAAQQPKVTATLSCSELFGFLGEEGPVGSAVNDDGLDLLAEDAALGVDLVEGEEQHIAQRGFADSHGAAEGMEDADFDGFGCVSSGE